MPFCPDCEYEYEESVTVCQECGTPLIDILEEEGQYICDACKEPLKKDARWCPDCGTIFVDTLRCFRHPRSPAHGKCVVCGQHLCPDCTVQHMGRNFCEQDAQVGETAEETPTSATGHDWEAEMLKRHLERGGVASRLFLNQDTGRVVSREDTSRVKLVVSYAHQSQVERIFRERDIEDRTVLYECEGCSAIFSEKDAVCAFSKQKAVCPNCRE